MNNRIFLPKEKKEERKKVKKPMHCQFEREELVERNPGQQTPLGSFQNEKSLTNSNHRRNSLSAHDPGSILIILHQPNPF
jgi:hypothetical protein